MTVVEKKDGKVRKKNKSIILAAAEQEFLIHGFKGAAIKRIAERADLPRANVHYYFKSKEELYSEILNDIVGRWQALSNYIRAKIMFSKTDPERSRIFASEIIHGAPHIKQYLKTTQKQWVEHKVEVIQAWMDQGKIAKVDPLNLLFFIWGATQHYADFSAQVLIASDKTALNDKDYEKVADDLVAIVLRGIGLNIPV